MFLQDTQSMNPIVIIVFYCVTFKTYIELQGTSKEQEVGL